ncbi:hypothetical protein [Spiroplasma platyhelix]|uniref:Uncharacterized protein n=1 Tax=Spiroplasma platyhelix PALS-1 TaxID=1276218 RepID=A0A846UDA3_9MOLU|nr:hypothetical protein [Spiroplasma platyhelix]MBE4704118.1 hypothetical protein [Spiroplasma platyhelix PALS-1]NKE38488.1 hypothetical protein [Spiroplasma platyhelix PALS-1]UJB29376.1 hypothetical protein SPLAT_v1c06120 [Spiroplasma platyhelix PALS-1]
MRFLKWFKKQNWGIKVGYIALVVSFVALVLGLILIGTANFVPKDSAATSPNLIGNGFEMMYKNGVSPFLTSQGYADFKNSFSAGAGFVSAPLIQLIFGIVFLIILLPTFGGICILALAFGYFKRWLYT